MLRVSSEKQYYMNMSLLHKLHESTKNSMASCQKGPTCHACARQIGPFWQDTLESWIQPKQNKAKQNHANMLLFIPRWQSEAYGDLNNLLSVSYFSGLVPAMPELGLSMIHQQRGIASNIETYRIS